MAGDGQCQDHMDTITDMALRKVHRLADGRIVGGAGNSFDVLAWRDWLESGKQGDCPIDSDRFTGIILHPDGVVHWVDHKGREYPSQPPVACGSGQDYAFGAFHMGATPEQAVAAAVARDVYSGGAITTEHLEG